MRPEKLRGVRREGKKYEFKALEYLEQRYKDYFVPSPWIQYYHDGAQGIQWCQPDGLLFDLRKGNIIIVEIKLRHTEDAWWQLKELYRPVIDKIFGRKLWNISLCEFVKWYDCAIPFPEPIVLREDVKAAKPDQIQVTIWRP